MIPSRWLNPPGKRTLLFLSVRARNKDTDNQGRRKQKKKEKRKPRCHNILRYDGNSLIQGRFKREKLKNKRTECQYRMLYNLWKHIAIAEKRAV